MSDDSDSSDIELRSALPKKNLQKMPKSPSEDILKKTNEIKKPSTKDMITEALIELKSRKGVSLYAIKKYITDKHHVDTDKINYIIKKNIKKGVETGAIVQMKGVGASGSFKLAVVKKVEKKEKKKPADKEKSKSLKKPVDKEKSKSLKKPAEKPKKVRSSEEKTKKLKSDKKTEKPQTKKVETEKSKVTKEKKTKNTEEKKEKIPKNNMAKVLQTPAKKKKMMMKRKSIGSIIKPPKMKPKAKV